MRLIAACAAVITAGWGCSRTPPLPDLQLDSFAPEVRKRVETAVAAARAHPQDAETVGNLGMLLHAYDRFDPAVQCYARAGALVPGDVRWVYLRAVALDQLGRKQEAIKLFRRVTTTLEVGGQARVRLAGLLRETNKLDESERLYRAVIAEHPEWAAAHYGLGLVLLNRGRHAEARESFLRALELAPGAAAIHYSLAVVCRNAGDLQNAGRHMELYRRASNRAPPPLPDPWMEQVRELRRDKLVYLQEGRRLLDQGDPGGARAAFEKALEFDPDFLQAHINLIAALGSLGEFDGAERHYRRALEINPDIEELHYNWGVVLVAAGRLPEAEAAFRRALEINPANADAHQNLGYLLEKSGRLDEAAAHYWRALEARPGHRLANFHLGRYYVQKGDYAKAIEHLEKSIGPDDERAAAFRYGLADAYARAGDRRRAIEEVKKALVLAKRYGQTALAASLQRDLKALQEAGESRR